MSKQKPPYKSLRYFVISLILLVLLACALPFFLKGPGNKKLISPDQFRLPEIKFLKKQPQDTRSLPIPQKSSPGKKMKKIYKWEDKDGVLHFTDYPNPDGPSQLMIAAPDKPDENKSVSTNKNLSDNEGNDRHDDPSTKSFPMILSPAQVKKLKQDAEKIRKDLQDRANEMDKLNDHAK